MAVATPKTTKAARKAAPAKKAGAAKHDASSDRKSLYDRKWRVAKAAGADALARFKEDWKADKVGPDWTPPTA